MTPVLPPWRRLHVRAAAAVLLVLAALGAATAWISWQQARDGALEATQRLELGLAATIVSHLPEPLVDAAGGVNAAPVRALASHVMMLNPSAEVYLLDAGGRVRAHALAGTSAAAGTDPEGRLVDLGPVRALLETHLSGAADLRKPLWTLAMLLLWLRRWGPQAKAQVSSAPPPVAASARSSREATAAAL